MLAALKLGHLVKLHTSLIKEKDFFSPPHLDNHGLEVTFLRSHTTDLLDTAAQRNSSPEWSDQVRDLVLLLLEYPLAGDDGVAADTTIKQYYQAAALSIPMFQLGG